MRKAIGSFLLAILALGVIVGCDDTVQPVIPTPPPEPTADVGAEYLNRLATWERARRESLFRETHLMDARVSFSGSRSDSPWGREMIEVLEELLEQHDRVQSYIIKYGVPEKWRRVHDAMTVIAEKMRKYVEYRRAWVESDDLEDLKASYVEFDAAAPYVQIVEAVLNENGR
jgi:hypothetical protein